MKSIALLFSFLTCSHGYGQEPITLQFCLDQVESNSLQIASESALLNNSRINKQFHWCSLLPDLSANAGITASFGRRLDPFTNTFATNSVNSQSFGLSSGMQLFNGFAYFHKRNVFAATSQRDEISIASKQNELKIQVIETYIGLCKLSVQIRLAELRIEKYRQIQRVQEVLIREGRINVIDTLKSRNSVMEEENLLISLTNELKLKNIQLNFYIGLPLSSSHSVDPSSISVIANKPRFSERYVLETLEMEAEILEYQLKTDRSKILPSVSFNALLGTGFSTNNKDYLLPGNPTKRYEDQINQNLYEGIGFYLSMPLFNRGEWLKTKQLNAIRQTELSDRTELAKTQLEKQQVEQHQKQVNLKAKLEQSRLQGKNLELIYETSLLLYEAGRLTYTEIERALMEWQLELVEEEGLRLDLELLKLVE